MVPVPAYLYSRMQRADIHCLPVELIDAVLQHLDLQQLRSCLLVCQAWRPCVERILYACPRISGPASMDGFLRALQRPGRKELRYSVRGLHILGKANYSSPQPTAWILHAFSVLGPGLPAVRSLTLENVEGVSFTDEFWTGLSHFAEVTEFRVRSSKLCGRSDAMGLFHAFPKVNALSIGHVTWPHDVKGKSRGDLPWTHRTLPLRSIELSDMNHEELLDALHWTSRSHETVRDMTLLRIGDSSLLALDKFIPKFQLESFTFAPVIVEGAHRGEPSLCVQPS